VDDLETRATRAASTLVQLTYVEPSSALAVCRVFVALGTFDPVEAGLLIFDDVPRRAPALPPGVDPAGSWA
jgi:hypothetical protein